MRQEWKEMSILQVENIPQPSENLYVAIWSKQGWAIDYNSQ